MTQTRFPVLVRLNKFGVIEKVVIPDLCLEVTSSIPYYNDIFVVLGEEQRPFTLVREYLADWLGDAIPILRDVRGVISLLEGELQSFINFLNLKDITPLDESVWVVKKNDRPIQWGEMSVKVPQSRMRCKNIMTPLIVSLYVGSTLLDAFYGYFYNAVNSVPVMMAAMTIFTDIITTVPDFFASGIDDNADQCFSLSPKKIDTGYQLSEDFVFEERIVGKNFYWILGGVFFVAQCISTGSELVSNYVNDMSQYDASYSQGYVPTDYPYNVYKGFAILDYVLDNAFNLLVPFSTMITVGPKVGKVIEKAISKCRTRCTCCRKQNSDVTVDVVDEKVPDERKIDIVIHAGYDRNGFFGKHTAAGLRTRLISEDDKCEPEPDSKDYKSNNNQPPSQRRCFLPCAIL